MNQLLLGRQPGIPESICQIGTGFPIPLAILVEAKPVVRAVAGIVRVRDPHPSSAVAAERAVHDVLLTVLFRRQGMSQGALFPDWALAQVG